MPSLISCRGVSVRFDDDSAGIDHLDFEVHLGEFVTLTGRSGAGKSTLLRLLAAEALPTEGIVLLGGSDPAEWSKCDLMRWRRSIGYAAQGSPLLQDRSIRENVAYGLRIRQEIAWPEALTDAERLLERLALAGKASGFPQELSGGEQQRTAFAQAIVGSPWLVLADEPTSNLDPANARLVVDLLSELNEQGTTIVVATHSAVLQGLVSARRVTLEEGRIAPMRPAGLVW